MIYSTYTTFSKSLLFLSSYSLLNTNKEDGNSQVIIWEGLYSDSVVFNTGKPLGTGNELRTRRSTRLWQPRKKILPGISSKKTQPHRTEDPWAHGPTPHWGLVFPDPHTPWHWPTAVIKHKIITGRDVCSFKRGGDGCTTFYISNPSIMQFRKLPYTLWERSSSNQNFTLDPKQLPLSHPPPGNLKLQLRTSRERVAQASEELKPHITGLVQHRPAPSLSSSWVAKKHCTEGKLLNSLLIFIFLTVPHGM